MTPKHCQQCGEVLKATSETEYICKNQHQNWNNPRAATTVIIHKNGKILVSTRGIEPYKGKYDLPGGFLEFGEQPELAATREVLEETSINVSNLELVAAYTHHYLTGISVTDTIYLCGDWDGTPSAQDDVAKLDWMDPSIIDDEDFAWNYPGLTDTLKQRL